MYFTDPIRFKLELYSCWKCWTT